MSSSQTPVTQPDKKVPYHSLPNKGQLAIQCLAHIADPLAISSTLSYMPYQLWFFDPHASLSTISTQISILIGARTAAQVFTGIIWGRLADSDVGGRKMVLFIGLVSCGISYIGYGLARSLAAAILWQVFAGIMSNNIAITRCVVAELNPGKKDRTRALLLLFLCASTASLLGPYIGGFLGSNVQSGYPGLLPNLLIAGLYFMTAALVFMFMEETLESLQGTKATLIDRVSTKFKAKFSKKPPQTGDEDTETSPLFASSNNDTPSEQMPLLSRSQTNKLPFRQIWTPNVLSTMLSQFIIASHLQIFSYLWASFVIEPVGPPASSPIHFSGGLGMVPRDFGLAFSLLDGISMLVQLVLYPMLQERFGTLKLWRTALFLLLLVYLVAPYMSLIASSSFTSSRTAITWVLMSAVLLPFTVGRMGVTLTTTLLINDCTPHRSVRGTIHATATVLDDLSRSTFPLATIRVFFWGLRIGIVGLGFWCLALLAITSIVASRWVREGKNGKEILLGSERSLEVGGSGEEIRS